jgi:serine/threonine protein kinase
VLAIADGVAATLAALHDGPRRIVHRDVTTGNVFFAAPGGPPVLGDFGMAYVEGGAARPAAAGAMPTRWSGPCVWRPPELDAGDGYTMGPAGDVFMLGALVYNALSGGRCLPPATEWGDAPPHTSQEHTLRRHTDPTQAVAVAAVERLLGRMLARDPACRPAAREVTRTCRAIRSRLCDAPTPHAGVTRAR